MEFIWLLYEYLVVIAIIYLHKKVRGESSSLFTHLWWYWEVRCAECSWLGHRCSSQSLLESLSWSPDWRQGWCWGWSRRSRCGSGCCSWWPRSPCTSRCRRGALRSPLSCTGEWPVTLLECTDPRSRLSQLGTLECGLVRIYRSLL